MASDCVVCDGLGCEHCPRVGRWTVMGRSGPLGRGLTREGAEDLARVSGGRVVTDEALRAAVRRFMVEVEAA